MNRQFSIRDPNWASTSSTPQRTTSPRRSVGEGWKQRLYRELREVNTVADSIAGIMVEEGLVANCPQSTRHLVVDRPVWEA
jgi:hypothetical protein